MASAQQHRWHHHSEEERRKWQDPEAVLAGIGLAEGDVFIDVGCGNGFFALPAARAVGKEGRVIGIDVDAESVAELGQRARAEGLDNVELMVGEAEDIVGCESCADVVFLGIDLHDFRDQDAVLANARSMIKPSGLLVDLDWKKEETPLGPPYSIRFSEQKASEMIRRAGFAIESVAESGRYHYLIEARPERRDP
jgi:ubiquinone/menaquinone biosynthesis C-methylase UbiE